MEERGFPNLNPEDEFKLSVEQEDVKDGKKSRRKKRFEKIINFLIPKKNEEETVAAEGSEDKSKTERFLETSKNLFGKMLGIEREKIEEPEDYYEDDNKRDETPRSLKIGALFREATEEDEYLYADKTGEEKPSGLIADEEPSNETLEEQAETLEDEQMLSIQKEVEAAYPSEIPVVQAEEHERVRAEEYEPVNRAAEHEIIDRAEIDSEVKHATAIERKDGTGAALLGFVAAETLSRSRDKKIRKQADKLAKRVEANKKDQNTKNVELEALQIRQREEIESLKSRRKSEREEIKETQPKPTMDVTEIYSPQRPPQQEIQISTERLSKKQPDNDITEKLHFEQIEQAAENDIPIESYYERRHEAKDVASTPVFGNGVNNIKSETLDESDDSPQILGILQEKIVGKTNHHSKQIYKDAVRQGATSGLVVVAAVAVILLIWSLL